MKKGGSVNLADEAAEKEGRREERRGREWKLERESERERKEILQVEGNLECIVM